MTPTDRQPVNQFELQAREAKCNKLAKWLYESFLLAVADQTADEWRDIAAQAGVANPPSEASQKRVLEILKDWGRV